MNGSERFKNAIERIDAANGEDPRIEEVDGVRQPRELLFARCVYDWVGRLAEAPSEELLLAARAHTLKRWAIPRDEYPRTTMGYHEWRGALAKFHAEQAKAILEDVGYEPVTVERVRQLITREKFPADAEARTLEDGDCLAFLELKFKQYLDEWDTDKTVRILRGTLQKMTPKARELAAELNLSEREFDLIKQAGAGL